MYEQLTNSPQQRYPQIRITHTLMLTAANTMHARTRENMDECMHVNVCVRVCGYVYVYVHVHIHACAYVCVFLSGPGMHACMYVGTCGWL